MPSLICAECGHANGGEARFCEECGSSLAPRCASCGAEMSPTARFCSSCGSPVGEAPAPAGALKVVSVVFSDVVGSTALQETLEAESVRRVMARFYEAMRGVVEHHGGAIQKFIGDAVVAVFGVPSVSEDDALRAVRCAVAMTETLGELNDELEQTWGVRLQTRTGVNTGELAISGEGIFVGDTMNTAARLEQAADAGQVLLGEATWRLVRHEVEVEEIAPLELKGKAGPVRVWRVESVQPRGTAAAEAPLVGRASELERLGVALDQATADRLCRLITVIGSPGLGKSRLVAEFARSLEGRATVLEGHCEQSGEGITFLPVAEVLRAAASIADDDPSEQVVAKLTEIVPVGLDRERVVARVAGLLGVGPPAAPEETFWAVRIVLESLARERPLVVVLDDVHWGQPMFLDLIEHLVEWARDAAILLVALARPELREVRGALAAAGRRAADVIELDPLGPDQSRELVGGLLGRVDVPDELLERILETTEGNPLFLGELLRMLVEEGSLERSGDVWIAAGGAEAVQVPPTIQALLTARIERLRADERSVVERAAVIGKQFYRGAVAELVAPPVRSGIDGHLETLRRKDMVEPEGTYWIDEPVYRFHHVLIRDAAYHLLLKEARAELHERFADWLETKAGDLVGEHEEVIAYHLEQAHEYRRQLGPLDERGKAVGARAAQRLASAGRRALAREDLAAASNLLQRALDRDAGVSEEEMLWHLGEALLSAGDTAGVGPVLERLSGARGDVLGAQLSVLTGTGSLEETLERVSGASSALAAVGDDAAEAKGHHVTAQVQAQLGRVADVETSLDRALLAARKADDRRRITAVLAAAPRAALWGPSPVVRASGRCLDVVRILRMTPGNRHVEAVALRCQAVLEAMRGRADAAREILAGGRATLEELGLTLELHELAMHAGIVELLAGQPDEADGLLRSARDGFAALGLSVSAAQAAALLARALIEQGRDEEALGETEYAEQHAGGDLKTTITWLGVRAEAIARRGRTDEALELARRAVALAEPTDALADKADANMALARVLRGAGRGEEARRAADAARALYQQKDHAVGVQRASELDARAAPDTAPRASEPAAVIDDPELAAHWARFVNCWEERDAEGLAGLYAEDYVNRDHRELGWGERSGHEANLKWARSAMDLSADLRVRLDRVIDCASGVLAVIATWHGHSAETGGEGEISMGRVTTVRDGKITRVEIFDPDAEISMRACFEDLRGRTLLGDRPPERYYERFVDCFGRHDREGLTQIWSADIAFIDHRQIAWEELHGLESLLQLADSAWQMSHDVRCIVDEVIACDDRVLAICSRYVGSGSDGGGSIEISAGTVNVTERGRVVRSEWFDHDDRDGMLARYRELGGTLDVLGDRPPERLFAEFTRRFDAHDFERLVELYHEDWTLTDHRQFGGDVVHGPRTSLQSVFAGSSDVRVDVEEVIACDDRVIALEEVYRGTAAEAAGGEFELRFGLVSVVEDGVARSTEIFDPDDRIAIMARWRELHGLGLLGDLPPERFWARWIECYARQDADRVLELIDEDYTFVDRRVIGWEAQRGPEEHLRVFKSGASMWRGGRFAIDEVLACDERVCAVRGTYLGAAADGGGQMEISVGYVGDFTDGGFRRVEQFEHDDTAGMLARYREFGGTVEVLGDRPPERWWAEFKRRIDEHDLDALLELYHEDWTLTDHRHIGGGAVHDPRAFFRPMFDSSPDVRVDVEEVIACDDRVIALAGTWHGTAHDTSGGAFELPSAVVSVIEEGRVRSTEAFDPEDRIGIMARWRELHGLGLLGDRPPERELARFVELWGLRDLDALRAHWPKDIVLVDHRLLAWEEVNGREGLLALSESAWKASPDIRLCVEEVMACDDRVLAVRCVYVGTGAEGAGMMELPIGFVNIVENGRLLRTEVFDPDDREALLARYRELGGEMRKARRQLPSELVVEQLRDAQNRRDYQRLSELVTDDWYMVDHRALGWPEARGRERCIADLRSVYDASPTVRLEYDEILAADEHVVVTRNAWRGRGLKAGEHEVQAGAVHLIADGRWAGVDFYDPDDRQAMIARYAELGGGAGQLGDRPPELVCKDFVRAFGTRDIHRLPELVTDDIVMVDHRGLAWAETTGRDAWLAVVKSGFDGFPDNRVEVQEVLACDERVMTVVSSWRGTADASGGGGAFEFTVGQVSVIDDGRFARIEQYEPDDRDAMLARHAELAGHREALGNRPPERVWARYISSFNASDFDALEAEVLAPDYVFEDHRTLGYEPATGIAGGLGMLRSARKASADLRIEAEEVFACDERVIALLVAWRGRGVKAGELEIPMGVVAVIEDDRLQRHELFNPDDRAAIMARYRELGGAGSVAGGRPPERWFAEFGRRWDAHDLDGLMGLYANGWAMTDHRPMSLWEGVGGLEGQRQLMASVFSTAPDTRFQVDEVLACDERVIALIASWYGSLDAGGGESRVQVGAVSVVEDGQHISMDVYEPHDHQAMIARYAELGGGAGPLGDLPPERFLKKWLPLSAANDIESLSAMLAEDFVRVDHRSIGWEPLRGRDANVALWRSAYESAEYIYQEVEEVLACDDRVIAYRFSWRGIAAGASGGGEFQASVGQVCVIEDRLWQSCDQYDTEDREAMLARYRELGGSDSVLGDRPSERAMSEVQRVLNARDYERLAQLVADDWYFVDHRALGWEEAKGTDECVAIMRSMFDPSPDVHFDIDELLAADDRLIVTRVAVRGHGRKAGEHEVAAGAVYLIEDGLWAGVDFYEPEDRVAMIARYVELGGGLGRLGDSAPERIFRAYAQRYAARDLEGMLALMTDDFAHVDHRRMGWEELNKERFAAEVQSVWTGAGDIRLDVDEVVAVSESLLLVIGTYRGAAASDVGAGEFEYPVGFLAISAGERYSRFEWFEPDGREAMLARYRELGGMQSILGGRPPERFVAELQSRLQQRDYEPARALVAEDWLSIDHRPIGWEDLRGRDAWEASTRSYFEASPNARAEVDEVLACDDRVIAMRMAWRDSGVKAGELEVLAGAVYVIENGLWISVDYYEPGDRKAMIARYVELGGGLSKLGDTASERMFAEYARRYAGRDYDGVLDLMAEDYAQVDHRTLGWNEIGKEQNAAEIRSVWAGTTDIRPEVDEVLAADDRVLACVCTYRGSADATGGGGQFEYPVGFLLVTDGQRSSRVEWFNPDDREAIIARYEELSAGPRTAERLVREYLGLIERRDLDSLRVLMSDEIEVVDHRPIAAPPGLGPDAALALAQSALDVTNDLRFETGEVVSSDERTVALRGSWIGTAANGEGELSLQMGMVVTIDAEKVTALHLYEHDDLEAIRRHARGA